MANSGRQEDLEESSSQCTTPGEVAAGGDGLGDSTEHVADIPTDESGSSDSGSEDDMDGVEEGHDLGGDREHLADREVEELDIDAFAKELASPSADTGAVGSRVPALSEQEEVAEDAPEDDNRGERQRRRRRQSRRTSGTQWDHERSPRAPTASVEPAAAVPSDSQLRRWFNDP
jgi:hypothetical protein